jgi:IS5 family transposase
MEESLYEIASMRHFAQINIEAVPDETTMLHFRHLLEKHRLTETLFHSINQHLAAKGLTLKQGTIVDATLINAPSSTKNAKGERNPDMHQTKKGKQWYFGMKADIGVDAQSGLVHHVHGQYGRRD